MAAPQHTEFPKWIKTHELSEGMTLKTVDHGEQTIEAIRRLYGGGGGREWPYRDLDVQFVSGVRMVAQAQQDHYALVPGPHFGHKYEGKVYYAGNGMPGGQVQPLTDKALESFAIRVTTNFGFAHLRCDLEELASQVYGESGFYQESSKHNGDYLIISLIRDLTPEEDFMVPNLNVKAELAKLEPRKWAGKNVPYGPVVIIKRVR